MITCRDMDGCERKQYTHEVCAGSGVRAGGLRVGERELPVSTSVIRVRQVVPAAHSRCSQIHVGINLLILKRRSTCTQTGWVDGVGTWTQAIMRQSGLDCDDTRGAGEVGGGGISCLAALRPSQPPLSDFWRACGTGIARLLRGQILLASICNRPIRAENGWVGGMFWIPFF